MIKYPTIANYKVVTIHCFHISMFSPVLSCCPVQPLVKSPQLHNLCRCQRAVCSHHYQCNCIQTMKLWKSTKLPLCFLLSQPPGPGHSWLEEEETSWDSLKFSESKDTMSAVGQQHLKFCAI